MPQSWLFSWLLSRPDILGTIGPASWLSCSGSVPTPNSGSLFTITVLKSFSELASDAWLQRVKRSCQPKFMVGFLSRVHVGGSAETRGKPAKHTERKRPTPTVLRPRESRSSRPRERLKRLHEPDPCRSGSLAAAGSRRRAHPSAAEPGGRRRRQRSRPARGLRAAPATCGARRGPERRPRRACGRARRLGAARAAAAARGAKS